MTSHHLEAGACVFCQVVHRGSDIAAVFHLLENDGGAIFYIRTVSM